MTTPETLVFFLGGRDLEMVTIRALLKQHAAGRFFDRGLTWEEARASAYRGEIDRALADGFQPVLVELRDDLGLTQSPNGNRVLVVDHHGERAGEDRPTALEQVFALLQRPDQEWTRELDLIAANDRGHVHALQKIGATPEEIVRVRTGDRAAQGITPEEEAEGRRAAAAAEHLLGGRLTVVRLGHGHSATVTDALEPALGGPGYENLLVLCPKLTMFFGRGTAIETLRSRFPNSFWGGPLPEGGYWGFSRQLELRDLLPILEPLGREPIPSRPAPQIRVHAYRQILIWPLLLKKIPPPENRLEAALEAWARRMVSPSGQTTTAWELADTLPRNVTPLGNFDEPTYEEMVYFHPFVRDFFYGDGTSETQDRPLRRLRRRDIRQVEIELTSDIPTPAFLLDVPRVELYLCQPLVALLVVEVAWPVAGSSDDRQMNLQNALALQSQFRQVYPPFFKGAEPGNCPRRVTWYTTDPVGQPSRIDSDFLAGRDRFATFTHQGAEPPVAHHWEWLLRPLEPFPGQHRQGFFYQQIIDDRIPGMTYLAVDDPRTISDGDFDRLSFCDIGGQARFPFSKDFLDKNRDHHAYDRFWRPTPDHDLKDYQLNTRYLCSGYQFLTIGSAHNWFFVNILPDHFRRHYFKMGLILHFHRAALLKFADELAEVIKVLKGKGPQEELGDRGFREKVAALQMTFLKFRSRSWFTEVSNQLQGGELFTFWSGRMGTEKLFHEVDATSQRLYEALAEHEGRSLSRSQHLLALIATFGLVLALWLSGSQIILACMQMGSLAGWRMFDLIVAVAGAVAFVSLGVIGYQQQWPWLVHLPRIFFSQVNKWISQWNQWRSRIQNSE
ncbi:MAG: hypothetical protein JO112_00285 [Planctomycetes bacterium]|nr:hypothetical protein [Planctomycetota bacterium]